MPDKYKDYTRGQMADFNQHQNRGFGKAICAAIVIAIVLFVGLGMSISLLSGIPLGAI